MHRRFLLGGIAALLICAPSLSAQQSPPLQFKLINVTQATNGVDASKLVQSQTKFKLLDLSQSTTGFDANKLVQKQFKVVDLSQATKGFDPKKQVQMAHPQTKFDYSRFLVTKLSVAPFPARDIAPSFPTSFGMPTTTTTSTTTTNSVGKIPSTNTTTP